MIISEEIHSCRDCQSTHIVKNGKNVSGNQQYRCKDCGSSKVLTPTGRYSEQDKERILRGYQERSRLRDLSRVSGVSRKTLTAWLKKNSTHCTL